MLERPQTERVTDEKEADIVELAAFRAKKLVQQADEDRQTARIQFRFEDDQVILDIDGCPFDLRWKPELASQFAHSFMIYAGLCRAAVQAKDPTVIKAREEARQCKEKRRTVAIVGKDGRKLPPLKVRGWALETWGGSPSGTSLGAWVRMCRPRARELDARRMIDEYVSYGYARDHVRVVAVDHRGRVIPPERMPTAS